MSSTEFTTLRERFQTLLSVAESIASCREPEELFQRLAGELQRVVSFDRLGLLLYDAAREDPKSLYLKSVRRESSLASIMIRTPSGEESEPKKGRSVDMDKKKSRKAKRAKTVKDLRAKTLSAKKAKGVRGGATDYFLNQHISKEPPR